MRDARKKGGYERVIVTLPKAVASRLRQYADIFRQGNKSGFVADALQAHMEKLKKARHTARLREAYALDRRRLKKRIGAVSSETMTRIEQAIRDHLGLPEGGVLP